ncbi:hypothetical protein [Oricola sp.]|uniref:hypothetical protein n=1 Tax=Oricola sp. TaxID=1979950 RepID=UPI000C923AB0|nr:hypothetical protein [Ahrensia sp.]|tara:strand:+ start:29588 stop:29785 length:198 start_codon:yes stop_codon:yes gene_type:complete
MAIDFETERALEARAESIRTRRGEELRIAQDTRHYLGDDSPKRRSWRHKSLMPLRDVFSFAEIES